MKVKSDDEKEFEIDNEIDNNNFINWYNRASDRVRQKMENSAAFSREIMRQERSIMRQIMRFF